MDQRPCSSVTNLSDVQGSSVRKTMTFSLVLLMAGIDKWDS